MLSLDSEEDLGLPFKVGQSFSRLVCFDTSSIRQFATLVGDPNPLHHDEEEAAKTRFGGLIASGTQISSILGAMVAEKLHSLCPSLGLEIAFSFKRPVLANVQMVARWTISGVEFNERLGGDLITFSGELRSSTLLLVSGSIVSLAFRIKE